MNHLGSQQIVIALAAHQGAVGENRSGAWRSVGVAGCLEKRVVAVPETRKAARDDLAVRRRWRDEGTHTLVAHAIGGCRMSAPVIGQCSNGDTTVVPAGHTFFRVESFPVVNPK